MGDKAQSVLVVDDERASREMLEMAIECWGYRVYLAADGREALAIFEEKEPGIVITDLVMPRLDGLGLLRALRRISPGTAVILITAWGSINDAIWAIKEGAADFLTKPIDYAKLRRLVEGLLPAEGKLPGLPSQDLGETHSSRPLVDADSGGNVPETANPPQQTPSTRSSSLKPGACASAGSRSRGPG